MKRSPLLYLFLITLFGAIARIWFFWTDGLHVDEYFTIELLRHDLWYVVQYAMTDDCNPPLFYILDWFSVQVFGMNAFAQRLPSIIAGILLIPAVYCLGKEYRGETLGLLSALAVSTLGPMWYYSQFGRAYMLECLLFTIFCIYYIRLMRGDHRTYHWIGLVITATLLAYTHLFSIVPLTLLIVCLFVVSPRKTLLWSSAILVLTAPLLLLFNAILLWRTVPRDVATQSWNWYGATVPQLVVFAPLEFFSYTFVFWIPMVCYATWIYRRMKEVWVIPASFILSFLVLLTLANTTPVFIRYMLPFVPVLVTIGLLPVADFIASSDHTRAQKWFVIGSFGIIYFSIVLYGFWTGMYVPKGSIMI